MASSKGFALVTGASQGIGLDLARECAQDGWDLVLVARSLDKLEAISEEFTSKFGVAVKVKSMDLSKADASNELVTWLSAEGVTITALINNAGFASNGSFAESDEKSQSDLILLNIHTLTMLTRLLLPDMIKRKNGYVLNLASIAAFLPGPLMAVYYASKAYVYSFSRALSVELEGTGVSCTVLCPGPTESGFQKRAEMTNTQMAKGKLASSGLVARAGYEAMMARKEEKIPGFQNQMVKLMGRLLNARSAAKIAMNAQKSH